MINNDQLSQWRAACEAATFEVKASNATDMPFAACCIDADEWYYVRAADGDVYVACANEEDAEFHALARTALPQAIEEIERLQGMHGPVSALERVLELEAQISHLTRSLDEMRMALVEACDIADRHIFVPDPITPLAQMLEQTLGMTVTDPTPVFGDKTRIAELRKIGGTP